jgi:hypothetical protein
MMVNPTYLRPCLDPGPLDLLDYEYGPCCVDSAGLLDQISSRSAAGLPPPFFYRLNNIISKFTANGHENAPPMSFLCF